MKFLKEVGLESEFWLLDDSDNIVEAPAYNFPADEMGFLIEIRSAWGSIPECIVNSLQALLNAESEKARTLGFKVVEKDNMMIIPRWKFYIMQKYNHGSMPDHTQNIYNHKETHHTGIRGLIATAGLHVHFSVWDLEQEDYYWMNRKQITEIVRTMDNAFFGEITAAHRTPGEWESKGYGDDTDTPHGFEYRSLPATADKLKVATKALEILNSVIPD